MVGKALEWVDDRTLRRGWEGKSEVIVYPESVFDSPEFLINKSGMKAKKGNDFYRGIFRDRGVKVEYFRREDWDDFEYHLVIKARTQEQADDLSEKIRSGKNITGSSISGGGG